MSSNPICYSHCNFPINFKRFNDIQMVFQNVIKIGSLLQDLRSQPIQFAKWLTIGEQMAHDTSVYTSILESIVTGFYGSLIFSEDTKHMLTLLYELAKLQLLDCDDPRRYY